MPRRPCDIDEATLRLLVAPGLGPATVRRLRERFGSDTAAVRASVRDIASIRGIGTDAATAARRALDDADTDGERAAMARWDAGIVLRGDADFPALLAAIPSSPEALWVRGRMADDDGIAIAVVGSRRSTVYGREQAARFATMLAQCGMTIVSGGAAGVDAAAHRGALRVGGSTVAVAGCGLAHCYPPQHRDLYAQIVEAGGALLSEFPMGAPPRAGNFPRRNRIISGLSLGVVVIEAAARSGALITARLAADDHGREVMAVPGRIDSPASAGCLSLLRDGSAGLVRSHVDVIEQLQGSVHLIRGAAALAGGAVEAHGARAPEGTGAESGEVLDHGLSDGQRRLVEALAEADGPVVVDQLAARIRRPIAEITADLTLLEIRGRIERDHRGIRLRRR